ncbi:MAG TPA: hypothetical protein VGG06_28890 [Thermoanaerobaculia bacterium]|jgi:hypothetical protein
MSSTNAPALRSRFNHRNTFHWLFAIFLVLTPQLVLAQSEPPPQGDEDPLLFSPDGGSGPFGSFLCHDSDGGTLCAAEVRFGGRFQVDAETGPDAYTFVLATHETVRLETRGEIDTRGALYDAVGRRLTADDDGGQDRNFRITRTLAPGRYYLRVAANVLPEASYELRTAVANPREWTGSAASALREAGNHCGRAQALAAGDAVDGRFERPGDVDVFAVQLAAPGVLEIGAEGALTYELKAADCATSIGLADGSLGSTLTPLAAGSYFVYVSQPQLATGDYRLRLALR